MNGPNKSLLAAWLAFGRRGRIHVPLDASSGPNATDLSKFSESVSLGQSLRVKLTYRAKYNTGSIFFLFDTLERVRFKQKL